MTMITIYAINQTNERPKSKSSPEENVEAGQCKDYNQYERCYNEEGFEDFIIILNVHEYIDNKG